MSSIRFSLHFLVSHLMKHIFLLLLIVVTSMSTDAFSDEIIIKDTAGFTRWQSTVDGSGNVEFSLVDSSGTSPDGVEVTITNTVTGETITAQAIAGSVVFPAVPSGTWVVASSISGITFTSVSVGAAVVGGAGAGAGAATLGSTALVVGGTAAIATGMAVANNNDSGDPVSPAS